MANIASARKRARQAIKRRAHNVSLRSRLRTYIKTVIKALDQGDPQAARTALQAATPIIDSGVNKGLIHKNKAARHKHRLHVRLKTLETQSSGQA